MSMSHETSTRQRKTSSVPQINHSQIRPPRADNMSLLRFPILPHSGPHRHPILIANDEHVR